MKIPQALRNSKLDPKTFKEDREKSLDSADRFFSNHLSRIRFLFDQGHYDEAIEELEKFISSSYEWTENSIWFPGLQSLK